MTNPYSLDEIRAAFERTVAWFLENPDKRIVESMSDMGNPFEPEATCFCFGGRLAFELGPLPHAANFDPSCPYEPGYSELQAIGGPRFDTRVYGINDDQELTLDEVIEKERRLFAERGLL